METTILRKCFFKQRKNLKIQFSKVNELRVLQGVDCRKIQELNYPPRSCFNSENKSQSVSQGTKQTLLQFLHCKIVLCKSICPQGIVFQRNNITQRKSIIGLKTRTWGQKLTKEVTPLLSISCSELKLRGGEKRGGLPLLVRE